MCVSAAGSYKAPGERKTSGDGMKGDKKERHMHIDMHVRQTGRQAGRQADRQAGRQRKGKRVKTFFRDWNASEN